MELGTLIFEIHMEEENLILLKLIQTKNKRRVGFSILDFKT